MPHAEEKDGPVQIVKPSKGRAFAQAIGQGVVARDLLCPGPRAQNETWGWTLRRTPFCLRKVSGMVPMERVGVRSGSKAGMASRMTGHHDSGTGGLSHRLGSVRSPEWVGMTSVPSGPRASCRARMTATGPPHTQPMALREEWASTTMPGVTPRARRSAFSDATVAGVSVSETSFCTIGSLRSPPVAGVRTERRQPPRLQPSLTDSRHRSLFPPCPHFLSSRRDSMTSPIQSGEPFAEEQTQEIVAAFHRDGFVHIPGVLEADEMQALRDRTDELLDDPQLGEVEDLRLHDRRYVQMHADGDKKRPFILRNTIALDPIFRDMLLREPILGLAEAVVGPNCRFCGQNVLRNQTAWPSRGGTSTAPSTSPCRTTCPATTPGSRRRYCGSRCRWPSATST